MPDRHGGLLAYRRAQNSEELAKQPAGIELTGGRRGIRNGPITYHMCHTWHIVEDAKAWV